MYFTKMEGLGNDYVYIDCREAFPTDLPALARRISDRHFGVGSDGLICIGPSAMADLSMVMFNSDGSEGKMCGNGIRCVGKFAYEKGLLSRDRMRIETESGIKELSLTVRDGKVEAVTVNMGKPLVAPPIALTVLGQEYSMIPVSMGNPHIVTFVSGVDGLDLEHLGPEFESHPRFPDRVNTEFVEVRDRGRLCMRVWERGSGETLACGTGACAALAAAVSTGRSDREATVELRGGELRIRWEEGDDLYMTGPAGTVFEGEWPEN